MKNIIATLLLIFSINTYAQEDITIKLSGKITNPNSDTLIIKNGWGDQFHLTTLKEDGTFSSEFKLPSGYYRINDLNESTTVYFGEGYDLDLTLNTDSFDESISYSGKGSESNNYLAKKALQKENWGKLDHYSYYCKLEEKALLSLTDSLDKVSSQLLQSSPISDNEFINLESQSIRCRKIYKLKIYQNTYRIFKKDKDFVVSEDYPNPFEDFEFNNPKFIPVPQYLSCVSDYLYYTRDTAFYTTMGDYSLFLIKSIIDNVENKEVQKQALHYYCRSGLTRSKKMDACFALYESVETDPIRLKRIEDKYLARKKTQKGAVSPPFEYEDLNGKLVTNEDLKGKLVYIDLWATWCGPCLREIPHFDSLQEDFKGRDIIFVSICQNDVKERWKKYTEKKQLKGIQLFAEGDGGQFYEDYQVDGIPRYILIDPQGKIIDSDAKRPSDKKLAAELEELLKE